MDATATPPAAPEDRTEPSTPSEEGLDERRRHDSRLIETGRLAALANHELRQPLLGIKAFSALIADRPEISDEVRDWARKIQSQALRLERIVGGLRDLSRPARPLRRRVLFDEAVAEVLGFATFLFREPHVHLSAALRSGAQVEVSVDELQQLVLNLLANARDAVVGQGGGRVQVVSSLGAGWANLYVADDGPGVHERVRRDLDAGFHTTKTDGSGLGLLVCREIARAHGGSLDLLDEIPSSLEHPARTVFRLRLLSLPSPL